MKTSNTGKVEIIGHEGIGLSKYLDSVGVWTIGAGVTKTEIPDLASWPLNKTITIQEAFKLFESALVRYEDELNRYLTRPILQTQFDALVSWCYNVGIGWVKKATVIKLLNDDVTGKPLYDALMMYKKPKEIIGRRTKEAKLIAYGTYSNNGAALLFPISSNGYPMYSKAKTINVWQYIDSASEIYPDAPTVPVHTETLYETRPSLVQIVINWFMGVNK